MDKVNMGKVPKQFGFKYLYGKNENFRPLLEEGAPLRFTDINHYKELENRKIADDESQKVFSYDEAKIDSFDADRTVVAENVTVSNVRISFRTRRCHTLCLSNSGYNPKLYQKFKSNICISLDVDALLGFLNQEFCPRGFTVVARNVTYFGRNTTNIPTDPEESVFWKDNRFQDEDEFRIALFTPNNADTVFVIGGSSLPLYGRDHEYIEISCEDTKQMRIFVKEARLNDEDRTLVFRTTFEDSGEAL
jgi:hypothetical protein